MSTKSLQLPNGACDCHVHIYDDRFPVAPSAPLKPAHSPVSEYRKLQAATGLRRVVIVQPTGYGYDNACTLEAVEELGKGARAIVVVPDDTSIDELKKLHERGARGLRFMLLAGGLLGWEALPKLQDKLGDLGWIVNLQLDGRTLADYGDILAKVPGKLVIDHVGKFLDPSPVSHPGFQTLLRLLDSGKCWVKLSAPYETSKSGAPDYDDVGTLASALVQHNPDRCLWASNWPHPGASPRPSEANLLRLLERWTDGNARTLKKVLVDNPAVLYGFGSD